VLNECVEDRILSDPEKAALDAEALISAAAEPVREPGDALVKSCGEPSHRAQGRSRDKVRSALTMLGVIIGAVAAVIRLVYWHRCPKRDHRADLGLGSNAALRVSRQHGGWAEAGRVAAFRSSSTWTTSSM